MENYGIINASDLGSIDQSNLVHNGLRYSIGGTQVLLEWVTDEVPSDIEALLVGAARSATAMRVLMDTPQWKHEVFE